MAKMTDLEKDNLIREGVKSLIKIGKDLDILCLLKASEQAYNQGMLRCDEYDDIVKQTLAKFT